MAAHRFQVRWQGSSLLPEDVYENVLYYDVTALDTIEGTCDGIIAAFDAAALHSQEVVSAQIRVYDLAGGQPTFQKDYEYAGIGAAGPSEVALCLSYAAVDDPSRSTARRRGRIYLGPIQSSQLDTIRPDAVIIETALTLGETLAQVGFASGTTWVMYSQRDDTTAKIESLWVDDTWDTQRRRGLAPTTRTVRDVQ